MSRPVIDSQLLLKLPYLHTIPSKEWELAKPQIKTFPANSTVFRGEDAVSYAVFFLDGVVRITNLDNNGLEMITNRLSAGDVCALMVLSGLSERDYPGRMIAETDVTALYVAKSSFLHWIQTYEPVRNAVFGNILDGMIQMGSRISANHHEPIEARLAKTLLQMTSEQQTTVRIKHHELASELNTAREVVSRALRRMRERGWITNHRGSVTIVKRDSLAKLEGD